MRVVCMPGELYAARPRKKYDKRTIVMRIVSAHLSLSFVRALHLSHEHAKSLGSVLVHRVHRRTRSNILGNAIRETAHDTFQ